MTTEKVFKDEPQQPVLRRWMCATAECEGEMICTGQGFTQFHTTWDHRCDKCGRMEGARGSYPGIVYVVPQKGEHRE